MRFKNILLQLTVRRLEKFKMDAVDALDISFSTILSIFAPMYQPGPTGSFCVWLQSFSTSFYCNLQKKDNV